MKGSAGYAYFNDLIKKIDKYDHLLSKSAKLKKAALKRAAVKRPLLSDWSPMIERAFLIWESAYKN